ncbi:hypothetical protein [Vitiosangium sp. GDMCC 1.1324]|uniref:hypothetical protein n=1 Tax=Vitiosangium sp. (strain GDMCC 1.1324) TaxID=2138576 RepID=UPI000D3B13A9|nr:hypothetical protein [Vitiosangium sp. GDMCC 1.1324]
MGKLITAILAIALTAGAAYYALSHATRSPFASGEPSSAKRQLDNVRGAASRIESDADHRAQELQEKMQDGQ